MNEDKSNLIEWARAGKELNDEFYKKVKKEGLVPRAMVKDELMQMGAKLWEYSYKIESNDDSKAFDILMKSFIQYESQELFIASGAPDMQILFSWAARWADQGFPHLIMGQKTAAALMASSANEDVIEQIHSPWKAFLIDIPKGLIEIKDDNENRYVAMTLLAVQEFRRGDKLFWNWRLTSCESAVQLWRFGITSKDLNSADFGFEESEMIEMYASTIENQDNRVAQLVGRLIIGVCLTFPENHKKIGSSHKIKGRWEKHKEQNICHMRNYELRPAITIDCREVISDYVRNGIRKNANTNRSAPTVRSLVRGHYRRPPHGIEKGAAKTVWVQPHWKNIENTVIAVRVHREKE